MNKEILQKVQEIISEQMGYPTENVTPNSELDYNLNVGSLDRIEIFIKIEDTFSIQISDEQTEGIEKVSDLVELIEKKISDKD